MREKQQKQNYKKFIKKKPEKRDIHSKYNTANRERASEQKKQSVFFFFKEIYKKKILLSS